MAAGTIAASSVSSTDAATRSRFALSELQLQQALPRSMHPKRAANPDAKRPTVRNRDMDALIVLAWDASWWCERGGKNHVKCFPPNDSRMVPIPSTPSGSRTAANKLAALRRGGQVGSPDFVETSETITATAVLFVAFHEQMSREQLEDTTLRLQRVLDEHAAAADGASASANFATGEVEIDLSIVGVSISAVHETIATVVAALERYGGIDPRTLGSRSPSDGVPPMLVRSSETQLVLAC